MKTLTDIRSGFLDYFNRHGHAIVESSPLVPRNDPTLMFANSGMVQFKNVFTGVESRPYTRATTAQKCVRAGGKHNDLENVGYTARHHTFFEMMGNFSFGDYFKEDAIKFAWELVTKDFGLPKDKLLVTVYHEDDQAADLWKKIAGFPEGKIIRIASSANFWRMGDTGPCGPCSEIFIDQGDTLQGGPPGSPDEDGDRYLEFWNLVFMQFEELPGGKRVNLPKPSVDTGMGLERMAAVMQGVTSNYDIDLFKTLIGATAELVKVDPESQQKPSFRVIADHLRASSFLMADGVMPGNEGRGYVLRRIMRRAMRHAHLLGAREPLMYRLVPELVKLMGAAYPELGRAQALITETLRLEETRFKQTLERGLKLLDEETGKLAKGGELAGEVAFKLYDTFGFPLDLTQDVLRGRGLKVDQKGFDKAMERQKNEARKSWTGSGEAATDRVWFELRDQVGATDFLGYDTEKAEGIVTAIVERGQPLQEAKDLKHEYQIVFNQTPFYGESGGQMGDYGVITSSSGAILEVNDTQKEAESVFVHSAILNKGSLRVGDAVVMEVDRARRSAIRANHSATHLLHEALRRTLGDHVSQKGSLVGADNLRFDFSHSYPLKSEEIWAVEEIVNERIRANEETITRILTPDEAVKEGAIAMFGEKYGDEVRVLSIGGREDGKQRPFSMELCGGTHVKRTGDIGAFKIVGESSVASGVRRISALTGRAAMNYFNIVEDVTLDAAAQLNVQMHEVHDRMATVLNDKKKLEKEVADLRRQVAMGGGAANDTVAPKKIGNIQFASRVLQDMPAKDLKPMADELKKKIGSGVVALASAFEGKVSLVIGVTDDLTAHVSAVDLARMGGEALGGKGGGGRPDMAQAGGADPTKINYSMTIIEQAIANSNKR